VSKLIVYLHRFLTTKKINTMKKVLSILAATAMFAIVACGPSAEEKAKAAEKALQDSIAQVDSANAAMMEMENAAADTTATADTTAAATEAPAAH
jgi:hypothetical protein